MNVHYIVLKGVYSVLIKFHHNYYNFFHPLAMSRDANFAITGSDDGSLKLWNMDMCQIIHTFCDHVKPISCVAMADNGSFAVSGENHSL